MAHKVEGALVEEVPCGLGDEGGELREVGGCFVVALVEGSSDVAEDVEAC